MRLAAGRLRHQATLYEAAVQQDALRGPYLAHTLAGARPCAQLVSRPYEADTDAGVRTLLAARFALRLDGLTRRIAPRWRVTVDSVPYDVVGVERDLVGGSVIVWAEARAT